MKYDCLALFSGGLDSLLAIKTIQKQGLSVLAIHFVTPFFGARHIIKYWKDTFNIEVKVIDLSEDFIKLLTEGPKYGFGKNLNPCIDCKILMLTKIKSLMFEYNAKFLITGEVVGQRPMSQTINSLNKIEKEAEVKGILVRPLSQKLLPKTKPERDTLLKREALLDLKGRSRTEQLKLARELGIKEEDIPSPAGGCLLTQKQTVKRYLKLLEKIEKPKKEDFKLSNIGRHFWKENNWLIIGREKQENEKLKEMKEKDNLFIEMKTPPGPSAIIKNVENEDINKEMQKEAMSACAYFSTKAREKEEALLKIENGKENNKSTNKELSFKVKPKKPQMLNWQSV